MNISKIKQELRDTSPLKAEYKEASDNGKCKCEYPLPLFAGPDLGYCFKCKKTL